MHRLVQHSHSERCRHEVRRSAKRRAMLSENASHGVPALEALTLKVSKEVFVSNHSGTNLTELCALVALVPVLACLHQQLATSSIPQSVAIRAVLQYVCVVVPVILAVMSKLNVALFVGSVCLCTMAACYQICRIGVAGITQSLQRITEQTRKR